MIASFRCHKTESLFAGVCPNIFRSFRTLAERKLQMLDSTTKVQDLSSPPGNRLEKLRGDRSESWSIRINNQWRICFGWRNGEALNVEIVDYH
ncbi:MAG TPA: type II toxin-antitoxin system RelE/ParE family toxin [Candidatus Lambdaproteobacteria bacterium]|nr:excinuclease ABC subunit A [Deltaproteobacteria bacterium]HIA58101.1 type II toxin-antitoxin system RelE/ParE family toxin [Candidatus Lambdaproteobacteria bacterium]